MADRRIYIYWPLGRFANAVFQLAYAGWASGLGFMPVLCIPSSLKDSRDLHLLAQILDVSDREHFYLDDLNDDDPRLLHLTGRSPHEDLEEISRCGETERIIYSHFQYHSSLIHKTPNYFSALLDIFKKDSSPEIKFFNDVREGLSERVFCGTHVRRGDYVGAAQSHPFIYSLEPAHAIRIAEQTIGTGAFQNSPIYLATDDTSWRSGWIDFSAGSETQPFCAEGDVSSEPSRQLLVDLAALSQASVFFGSNSSFSALACLLNRKSHSFYQFLPEGQGVMQFDPYNRPILYNAGFLRGLVKG